MWDPDDVLALPSALRAKIAVVILLGVFLIPLTMSSLRGLPHLLACEAEIDATLRIAASSDDDAVLLSADEITADEAPVSLCDGLEVDLRLASTDDDRAEVTVTISNRSERTWDGSLQLRLGDTPLPVQIGRVGSGATAVDTVALSIDPDRDYEITGALLVGP